MEKKEIPLQEIIDLLESKPSELWTTGTYGTPGGQRCALGFINSHYGESITGSDVQHPLRKLTELFIRGNHDRPATDIVDVNDRASVNGYTEPEPRARVLHLLNDMKKSGIEMVEVDQPKSS